MNLDSFLHIVVLLDTFPQFDSKETFPNIIVIVIIVYNSNSQSSPTVETKMK